MRTLLFPLGAAATGLSQSGQGRFSGQSSGVAGKRTEPNVAAGNPIAKLARVRERVTIVAEKGVRVLSESRIRSLYTRNRTMVRLAGLSGSR